MSFLMVPYSIDTKTTWHHCYLPWNWGGIMYYSCKVGIGYFRAAFYVDCIQIMSIIFLLNTVCSWIRLCWIQIYIFGNNNNPPEKWFKQLRVCTQCRLESPKSTKKTCGLRIHTDDYWSMHGSFQSTLPTYTVELMH